ncbi:MAG: hypothetical protein JRJ12_06835 [Deltaproteobacteria bacterium]|nr:hypothetical protein [Deltaproteobacteria bacterium]MBW2071110.1 hypothetical protein [Deltaproteobacteria bacterium]
MNLGLVDMILLGALLCGCVVVLLTHFSRKRKIEETERRIIALKTSQRELYEDLESRYDNLRRAVFNKTADLNYKINELAKSIRSLHTRHERIRQELDEMMAPLKRSVDESVARINRSQASLRKTVQENETEMKKIASDIDSFSRELKKMKDFLRERTIDLEL